MIQPTILIIENDETVAQTIQRNMRGENYKISVCDSGVEGLKMSRRNVPDLVILEVALPGMDGYTACREIRYHPVTSDVPILLLIENARDEDRIACFNAGADDYLCKPFNMEEMVLRVRAILRRTMKPPRPEMSRAVDKGVAAGNTMAKLMTVGLPFSGSARDNSNPCIVVSGYILDTRSYELVTPGHDRIRLTPIQYELMYHLMSHAGQIFSVAQLLNEVWDYPSDKGSPDLVRMHIKKLRERIEKNPRAPVFIKTVQGYGYTVDSL